MAIEPLAIGVCSWSLQVKSVPELTGFLDRLGIKHTRVVFGLLQNARVDENYVAGLIPRLPPGDSELYSHPSLDEFKHELAALISPRVRSLVQEEGVELIRYRDL